MFSPRPHISFEILSFANRNSICARIIGFFTKMSQIDQTSPLNQDFPVTVVGGGTWQVFAGVSGPLSIRSTGLQSRWSYVVARTSTATNDQFQIINCITL